MTNNRHKPNQDVNIRQMVADDISGILSIDKKIQGEDRASSYSYPDIDNFQGIIDFSFIAETENKIIGFVLGNHMHIGEPAAEVGVIQIIGITPDYRGQGIAGKLIDALTKTARERGLETVRVMLRDDDSVMSPFFAMQGFKRGNLVDYSLKL